MMRIIAGLYKNKLIRTGIKQTLFSKSNRNDKCVKSEYRPTRNDVRKAVFDMLLAKNALLSSLDALAKSQVSDDYLVTTMFHGLSILDLCCGSGAFGLESLSRGADFVTFVDNNLLSLGIVSTNLRDFGIHHTKTRLMRLDVRYIPKAERAYNLVYFDPPYENSYVYFKQCLPLLLDKGWLLDGATVILEAERHLDEHRVVPSAFEIQCVRCYGGTKIVVCVPQYS